MKTISALLLIFLFFPVSVSAHVFGQPPYFKINGKYSDLYPVPASSSVDFNLPQDLAVENYLVDQALEFELDTNTLPAPKEVIDNTEFFWDFGDGTKGTGLKNSHRYTKAGSYILSIDAKYISDPQSQLLQSVMFHILPAADYKLPRSVIKASGKTSSDPLTDIIRIEFTKKIEFDGSSSSSGTGKITSYLWDLGDTSSSNQKSLSHQYDMQLGQVFPVLRVGDENGFIADSFVEIENSPEFNQNPVGFIGENLEPKRLIEDSNPVVKILTYAVAAVLTFITAYFALKLLKNSLKKIK